MFENKYKVTIQSTQTFSVVFYSNTISNIEDYLKYSVDYRIKTLLIEYVPDGVFNPFIGYLCEFRDFVNYAFTQYSLVLENDKYLLKNNNPLNL